MSVERGADDYVRTEILAAADVARRMADDAAMCAVVETIAEVVTAAVRRGNKVLLAGNGGSAADAQHIAAELVGRFAYDRPGIAAIALTTDTSALTSIGNDYGFEQLFLRQVEALGVRGDVFIAMSTSGRSANVVRALDAARSRQIVTVGLTGREGGDMRERCDLLLCVPDDTTARIQQGHMVAGHIVCALVERALFPRP
jgi:D-sedoheptulose 7-phosphate isomerase